jgi:hypothetical protein
MESPFAGTHVGSRQWHTKLPSPLPSFACQADENRDNILAELMIVCNLFSLTLKAIRFSAPPVP